MISELNLNGRSLTNVDTIKKFTDILVLDLALLSNARAGQRDLCDVDAGDLDLILDVGCAHVGHALQQRDSSHLLLTQEVADLDDVLALILHAGDVDGEMCIAEAHLVLEALGDAGDHVLDVRADGSVMGYGMKREREG